jgi:hypothetical protein
LANLRRRAPLWLGEDRRPDRAPRSIHGLPAGRGGGAASFVRQDPAPDRALARTANGGGPTGTDRGTARAEGRIMRRDRPGASKHPGSARRSGSDGLPHTGTALNHALLLTGKRWRSRVPGGRRAHPGNVGSIKVPPRAGFATIRGSGSDSAAAVRSLHDQSCGRQQDLQHEYILQAAAAACASAVIPPTNTRDHLRPTYWQCGRSRICSGS